MPGRVCLRNAAIIKKISINRYVAENLETAIGDLQASIFLQFCLEEIGPYI